ncbi:(d)CMP kinase [Robiginitomaculum antarcticum]|uniref:(d)CMP kinase n=1 Tax=Robiginitomaculum antarcticum TaxID=437507 RepID=UPI0003675EAA|nr:(d)CMP kinase [Robiginitomaculum antarcticum]
MSVIAIDGTLASGKGTLAKCLAAHMGLPHLDTGKLYRAVGYALLKAGHSPDNAGVAIAAAQRVNLDLLSDPALLHDDVASAASKVAVIPGVRAALFDAQKAFAAQDGGAILDGRDIGTVICPNADVKLFIDADPEERARRRYDELISLGKSADYDTVLAQLKERDLRDSTRADAPLKPADDAHIIDTTDLSPDDALARAIVLVEAIIG